MITEFEAFQAAVCWVWKEAIRARPLKRIHYTVVALLEHCVTCVQGNMIIGRVLTDGRMTGRIKCAPPLPPLPPSL